MEKGKAILIGDVRVRSLYAIEAGNYKLSISIPTTHNYGYCREGEQRARVDLDLRLSGEEAVEWLPLVGQSLQCTLNSISEPTPTPPARSAP